MNYDYYMKKCIELAKRGEGEVSPNPLVGCVILDSNEKVISEGYHHFCGGNHAERDALLKLSPQEAIGGTLFVNLEPCSHYGKTPPCADLIIEMGLKQVVIGMQDVNPIVAGNGIAKLKASGIEVVEHVLEEECKNLNEVFIKNMTQHKTFVAIKTATTLDGKTATSTGSSKWITSNAAREEVQTIRHRYDAILTSSSTVLADNPTMAHKRKIILDRELKTDFLKSKIYQNGEIFVFHAPNIQAPEIKNIKFVPTPVTTNKLDIEFILNKTYEFGIMSILVEAGGKLNGAFLDFTDKIYQFIAPKIVGDNTALSCFDYRKVNNISDSKNFSIKEVKNFPPDILLTLIPNT